MTKTKLADFSLLMVALIWGATFVLVQNAISFLEPITFNAVRFIIAALILGGFLVAFNRDQFKYFNKKLLKSGVILGTWLFGGYVCQTIGLLYTTSSKAGFITGLSVVLVPLFSFLILSQRPSRNAVIGVLIATVGLYLLTMTDIASLNIGDGFVFIGAISFALQIVFTGRYSSHFPSLILTVVQISTVAILSSIFAFIFEDWQQALNKDVLFNRDVFLALFITSVFATALAFLAQTKLQQFTTPTRVALIFAMEPVFAAATAYIWADERLSAIALIGCLFIFAGMIFAELPTSKSNLLKNKQGKAV